MTIIQEDNFETLETLQEEKDDDKCLFCEFFPIHIFLIFVFTYINSFIPNDILLELSTIIRIFSFLLSEMVDDAISDSIKENDFVKRKKKIQFWIGFFYIAELIILILLVIKIFVCKRIADVVFVGFYIVGVMFHNVFLVKIENEINDNEIDDEE